jgi:predicted Rossmann-fold nucleotide-binding protein
MKKTEIESQAELQVHLSQPDRVWRGVILQGLDLRPLDAALAGEVLTDSTSFLGCQLGPAVAGLAVAAGAMVIPPRLGLAFDPFRAGPYTWRELFSGFQPGLPDSYYQSLDWLCYQANMDEDTKKKRADLAADDELLFRLHDSSQTDALGDFLEEGGIKKVVAIMGGHDLPRLERTMLADGSEEDAPYMKVALLGWQLSHAGYLIATGGGPGAMEAGNLGACYAFLPESELRAAVRRLSVVPKIQPVAPGAVRWNSGPWLAPAATLMAELEADGTKQLGSSIGIPTWFYGHEPPNVFASVIAKYFENSLREEGLLQIATHGVIYAEGNGGTVQEIFQDACQNYYATYGPAAPMILLGTRYWNRATDGTAGPKDKPAWPLLWQLGVEKRFTEKLLLTDSLDEVVSHIQKF